MKTKYTIPIMVSTAVLLAACGGGSDLASSLTTKSSFNLTGTVPGTLIEVFCEDGSYHSVNSDNNGTSKHPFALKLPMDTSCRLVMTTNEDDPTNKVITPIKFTDKDGVTSIAFSSTEDIDLNHVDLALDRSEMSSDTNGDGVEDEPTEIIVDDQSLEVIDEANDPLDDDNDGIINIYEDDDGDGINNHDDDDDDNDGVKDKDDSDNDDDNDGDGIDDVDDVDDDNDGLNDDEDEDDDNDGIKDDVDGDNNNGGNGNENPTTVTTPSAGRLLASQCAQCHRTDANPNKGFEDLIGEEIYGELTEMKRKSKLELMHLQAKGYSDAQIRIIDDYFNNLSVKKGGK